MSRNAPLAYFCGEQGESDIELLGGIAFPCVCSHAPTNCPASSIDRVGQELADNFALSVRCFPGFAGRVFHDSQCLFFRVIGWPFWYRKLA